MNGKTCLQSQKVIMKMNGTQFCQPMEQMLKVKAKEWSMHIVKWSFIRLNLVHFTYATQTTIVFLTIHATHTKATI